jgi:hypothetical protein
LQFILFYYYTRLFILYYRNLIKLISQAHRNIYIVSIHFFIFLLGSYLVIFYILLSIKIQYFLSLLLVFYIVFIDALNRCLFGKLVSLYRTYCLNGLNIQLHITYKSLYFIEIVLYIFLKSFYFCTLKLYWLILQNLIMNSLLYQEHFVILFSLCYIIIVSWVNQV